MYDVELVMKLDFKCSVTQYEQSNSLMSPEGGFIEISKR